MDLWIRSQDRECLIKMQSLDFDNHTYYGEIWANGFDKLLATYKTKERALEVLDEIMQLLKDEEMLHIRKSSLNNLDEIAEPKYILKPVGQPKVYEMPEE